MEFTNKNRASIQLFKFIEHLLHLPHCLGTDNAAVNEKSPRPYGGGDNLQKGIGQVTAMLDTNKGMEPSVKLQRRRAGIQGVVTDSDTDRVNFRRLKGREQIKRPGRENVLQ